MASNKPQSDFPGENAYKGTPIKDKAKFVRKVTPPASANYKNTSSGTWGKNK